MGPTILWYKMHARACHLKQERIDYIRSTYRDPLQAKKFAMTVFVERQGFSKWLSVAVLVVCAAAAATADTAALLHGNRQSMYLDCGLHNGEVTWYHNSTELREIDTPGSTQYLGVKRHKLRITFPTPQAAGLYQCKDSNGRVLKEYSGVTVYGNLLPDNCRGSSTPCIDVTEVVVVDLPPEQWRRYRISLSYRHSPTGYYPLETPHYPVHWIVQADNFDSYLACSRRFNNPCIFALCDKGRCRTSSYVAAGAGLSVTGEFGQEVEVDLTKLAPGDTNGMVEVLYQVNLPYRRDAVGKRNLVVLKKYRFNFRDFVYNFKVCPVNCSSAPCNVTVNEGDNVTVCSEMAPSIAGRPMPIQSTKWVFSGAGVKEEMMSQCKGESKCCEETGCSNRSSVSGEWGRCFSLTNVSMADSGRLLSFQVRSTRDNKVTTVNYTLHVTPGNWHVTPAVWEDIKFVMIIIAASVGGGILVLFLANVSIFLCCCCRKCRKSEHNRCEPMHRELPPVPPPVPPRRDFMRQTMSPYESSYIAITDLEPHEVAANDQTVSHNQVRVNGRDERSQSFYEELPPHTEASMLSVPPQAERSSSTPVLYSPPDVGVDGLSRSAR